MSDTKRNPYGRNEPERQEMSTPRWFFDRVQSMCHDRIALDVCALPSNAVVDNYIDKTSNGLEQRWRRSETEINWCNPPFAEAAQWLSKACAEARHGAHTIMLLPFRDPAARWVWTYAPHTEKIMIIVPRLRYTEGSPPFASSLWTITPRSAREKRDVTITFWHIRGIQ